MNFLSLHAQRKEAKEKAPRGGVAIRVFKVEITHGVVLPAEKHPCFCAGGAHVLCAPKFVISEATKCLSREFCFAATKKIF